MTQDNPDLNRIVGCLNASGCWKSVQSTNALGQPALYFLYDDYASYCFYDIIDTDRPEVTLSRDDLKGKLLSFLPTIVFTICGNEMTWSWFEPLNGVRKTHYISNTIHDSALHDEYVIDHREGTSLRGEGAQALAILARAHLDGRTRKSESQDEVMIHAINAHFGTDIRYDPVSGIMSLPKTEGQPRHKIVKTKTGRSERSPLRTWLMTHHYVDHLQAFEATREAVEITEAFTALVKASSERGPTIFPVDKVSYFDALSQLFRGIAVDLPRQARTWRGFKHKAIQIDRRLKEQEVLTKARRFGFGYLKGKVYVSEDFDDPIDDFESE